MLDPVSISFNGTLAIAARAHVIGDRL